MMNYTPILRRFAITSILGLVSASALASGPLNPNPNDPDGVERWPNGGLNIPFNPDGVPAGGPTAPALGPLTYIEAVAETEAAFGRWQSIPTATATYLNHGPMPFDIDETNFAPFIQNLFFGTNVADGFSPIVYDEDGDIFFALFGFSGVLGFASTDTRDADGNPIEAVSFLNGGSILGGFPLADFLGVIVHEFGHYSGLGHTVVNGQSVAFGDASGPTPFDTYGPSPTDQVETMYPFALQGGGEATPHADDIGFYSFLYPSATFFGGTGTISGTVLDPTGMIGLTGVNVIARNVADPFVDAVSAISGDRGVAGEYTINGLTPGAQYTVHIDQILQGGFSTPPIQLPGPEEFHNGGSESNNVDFPDEPSEATLVPAHAGIPTTGIDVIFNAPRPGDPLPLGDDDSIELFMPFPFEICGQEFNSLFVNSNGSVTFGAGDPSFADSVSGHLSGPPRIAGLWDDLNPTTGGIITFGQSTNSFTVIFDNVPEFFATGGNSFDITLLAAPRDDDDDSDSDSDDNGGSKGNKFRIDYGVLTATDGLAGYSCGGAITTGLEPESDLTELRQPIETEGEAAIYEQFAFGEPANDLSNTSLRFRATKPFRDRFEPNDTPARASKARLPFDTVDDFSDINPTGADVDWYRFDAEAGTTLIAEVTAGQLDSVLGLFRVIDLGCADDDDSDSDSDCDDDERRPVEVVELAVDDDSGSGLLSQIVFPILESGSYAVAVSTFADFDFTGDGGSGGRYVLDLEAIDGFLLNLGDDDTIEVDLGFTFPFQGQNWTSVFVNSNGNLTFGAGDTDFSESVFDFLNGPPRIAALFDDLSPNNGGRVIASFDTASFSVSFEDVPEFFSTGANTFTINLSATGDVTVDYGAMSATDGIAGVTEGNGAADPGATDLSAAAALSTVGTIYEQFGFSNPNDLAFLSLLYSNP